MLQSTKLESTDDTFSIDPRVGLLEKYGRVQSCSSEKFLFSTRVIFHVRRHIVYKPLQHHPTIPRLIMLRDFLPRQGSSFDIPRRGVLVVLQHADELELALPA